jgi:hypothetical protein
MVRQGEIEMAQYTAYSPQAEVNGTAVLSVISAVDPWLRPVLDRCGFATVDSQAWYPQQRFLDALQTIESQGGDILVQIGMKLMDATILPQEIQKMEDALLHLDWIYRRYHRNDRESRWQVTMDVSGCATCVSCTAYPPDLEYGMLYALARRFRPRRTKFSVKHITRGVCRQHGGDCCTYQVRWWS